MASVEAFFCRKMNNSHSNEWLSHIYEGEIVGVSQLSLNIYYDPNVS